MRTTSSVKLRRPVPESVGSAAPKTGSAHRIYYLEPRLAGPIAAWGDHLDRIQSMGFAQLLLATPFERDRQDPLAVCTLDRLAPSLGATGPADDAIAGLVEACTARGLSLFLDVSLDRVAADGALAATLAGCWLAVPGDRVDPRSTSARNTLRLDLDAPALGERFVPHWQDRLARWAALGVSGIRCHNAHALPLDLWRRILTPLRDSGLAWTSIGWLPGAPRLEAMAAQAVFDLVTSSAAWWDGRAPWIAEEYNALRPHGRPLAFPDDPFGRRLASRVPPPQLEGAHRRALAAATHLADGWLMPMGFEYGATEDFARPTGSPEAWSELRAEAPIDLTDDITVANERLSERPHGARLRLVAGVAQDLTLVHREVHEAGELIAINPHLEQPIVDPSPERAAARVGARLAAKASRIALAPGGAAAFALEPSKPIVRSRSNRAKPDARSWPRIAIEAVSPVVDGGRFPAKRIAGDRVLIEADIFTDGHEALAAELRWKASDEKDWSSVRMELVSNDRWRASFPLLRVGPHQFCIEAWWDHFATFRRDLIKKRDAGRELALEIAEGRLLLEQALGRASGEPHSAIEAHLARLGGPAEDAVEALLSGALLTAMDTVDERPFATGGNAFYPIDADRERAAFASWYELFPRSITDSPARHGTFKDVIGRLPAIRDMGFDVLYFPPIHPIGHTNRKGKNNSLTAGPDDPGSPYAIGSKDGGHDSIHPELGTREDFRALVRAAEEHGLEIALDFAIQCSPDHPWLTEHPDWFQWRPDGSMKYAENPPKKYEDIVNVDFYAPGAVPDLWLALRDVLQFWVDQGVRTFRVDNPHTKPFPFWEWLIADIRSRDPGVIFLAEAFTRPKVMYRLGKLGFAQSYTYFTWRNTKQELTDYLTELSVPPASDLYRPHFFVNTPDINPVFLQRSGRPGFLIRAALAATLSGLWGVYSGFELCEGTPVPGKEEYLDSEKYEIKPRDTTAPGNIIAEITRLNAIRRSYAALQSHTGVTFYNAFNDYVLYYGKRLPDAPEIILAAVNLDPQTVQSATVEIPLWEFGLPDHATVDVEDLMSGQRFALTGKLQTITLDPGAMPFVLWRITPRGRALL